MAANTPSTGETGTWDFAPGNTGTGGSFGDASSPTSTFTGTAGQSYRLRWRITNSTCTTSDEVTVTLNVNPTQAAGGPDQVVTCGSTSATLAANTPGAGETGSWSIVSGTGGSFEALTSPTSSFTGVFGEAYVSRWTITNGVCASPADDVVITFFADIYAQNAQLCSVGGTTNIIVKVRTNNTPYQYTLLASDGTTVLQSGSYLFTVGEGTYFVRTNDASGCEITSGPITVTNPPNGSLSLTNAVTNVTCSTPDGTITPTASGGYGSYQYSINGDDFFPDPHTFTGLAAGNYRVTVKDANGCALTEIATVKPGLSAKLSAVKSEVCFGGTTTLTVSATGGIPPYMYALNGGTPQTSNKFIEPAGSYQVAVMDVNGCTVNSNSINITQPATALNVSATVTNESCPGANDGSITATGGGGVPPYRFRLDLGSFQTGSTFTGLAAYNHRLTILDAIGCSVLKIVPVKDALISCITGSSSSALSSKFGAVNQELKAVVTPNPSNKQFNLVLESKSNEKVDIIVTDMYGKKVYKTTGSGNQKYIFGEGLSSGMYILQVIQGKEIQTLKLLKGN